MAGWPGSEPGWRTHIDDLSLVRRSHDDVHYTAGAYPVMYTGVMFYGLR
jgi:hypothetical protein